MRRFRRWAVALTVLLIAVAIGGWPVYVRPQTDPLRHADAIVVLGGPGYDRYPFAIDLGAQGWTPMLAISKPEGAKDASLTRYCTTVHPQLNVQCFAPDPSTTKGEGRELRRLAAKYGWRTVIVVTFRPHISRARFILQQCFDGDLIMVESPAHLSMPQWVFQYVYQTAGYVRAKLQPGC